MKHFPACLLLALALLTGAVPALLGCQKDPTNPVDENALKRQDKFKVIDDSVIRAYLTRNKFEPSSYTRTSSGLYLVTLTSNPQGALAAAGKRVAIKYEGRLISKMQENNIFDTTYNSQTLCQCAEFIIGDPGLIPGWTHGVPLMRQGEHKLLLVPSYLAYGPRGVGTIAPDTPLLFDMIIATVSN